MKRSIRERIRFEWVAIEIELFHYTTKDQWNEQTSKHLFGYTICGALDMRLNWWLWYYLNAHQQFEHSIIFKNIGKQRKIKSGNACTKKATLFLRSISVIYRWKVPGSRALKFVLNRRARVRAVLTYKKTNFFRCAFRVDWKSLATWKSACHQQKRTNRYWIFTRT